MNVTELAHRLMSTRRNLLSLESMCDTLELPGSARTVSIMRDDLDKIEKKLDEKLKIMANTLNNKVRG